MATPYRACAGSARPAASSSRAGEMASSGGNDDSYVLAGRSLHGDFTGHRYLYIHAGTRVEHTLHGVQQITAIHRCRYDAARAGRGWKCDARQCFANVYERHVDRLDDSYWACLEPVSRRPVSRIAAERVVPLFAGVYWQKANARGAVGSIVVGTTARLVAHFVTPPAWAGLDTLIPPMLSA